ncbi:hypothetical protein ASG90_13850 [Nocardioides sp. Soil797]|nr:hypothetical protein ASG90_13850 [Nocardioides sp. Soil797]
MTSLRHQALADQRATGLTAAERARTLIAGSTSLRIGILNLTSPIERHAVLDDGSVLFVPSEDATERVFAVGRNLPPMTVQLTAWDVGAVAGPDRIRGSLTLSGKLAHYGGELPAGVRAHLAHHAEDADTGPVLVVRPARAALSWHCEASPTARQRSVDIAAADYRAAQPDPLLPHESEWLTHMQRDHPDVVRALAHHVLGDVGAQASAHPLCLDRFGVVVRVQEAGGHRDGRVDFARPLVCGCELHEAILDLLHRVAPDGPFPECSA